MSAEKKMYFSVFSIAFKSVFEGANVSLFLLWESDHKSETTMMTQQMRLSSNGATVVCLQRLYFQLE